MVIRLADEILVEVAFAEAGAQSLLQLRLPAGATVGDAIELSQLAARHPQTNLLELPTGIWGRPVAATQPLRNGDRVEIYRELSIDPREARRQLALSGRTMREGDD